MARSTTRTTKARAAEGFDKPLVDLVQDVDIAVLNERIERLNSMVLSLAGLGAVDTVLTRGFDGLFAQLQPLRDMAPERALLDENQSARLQAIRSTLARQDWDGISSFPNNDQGVPFIFGPDAPVEPYPYGRGDAGN